MSDVSVIGTGAMGSALAASGAEVTVWNRTSEKAEALSGPRVRLAESVGETLTASPLTIVSVSDHEVARALVEFAGQDLDGKVVASTSFVTPDQAQAFSSVVALAGGVYLDLAIVAEPDEVRSGVGTFFVSGERTGYEAHRDRLERIGRVTYVDGTPASAYISGMAVTLAYLPMAVGLLQGARIAEAQDRSPGWFRGAVLDLYPFHIERLLDRFVAQPEPVREPGASVDAMAAWAAHYGAALRELGLDPGMFEALDRLFTAASDAGRGDADWTSVAEPLVHPGGVRPSGTTVVCASGLETGRASSDQEA
jgi:3-hydroxyisobutyrate dehydrogenase-like beta-hydroxyacid dehydrogenase